LRVLPPRPPATASTGGRTAPLVAALWVVGLATGLGTGCYTGSAKETSWPRIEREPGWSLVHVPYIPQQEEEDCGAAALAMATAYWKAPLAREEIVRQKPPQDGGIRAGDLRDLARQRGFEAFLVQGTFHDFDKQLALGRPLIVGTGKPILGGKVSLHYEVIVGFNRTTQHVLSWDPALGLREYSPEAFAREWAPSDRLTLILFKPGVTPG